ncbi:hypothetical protein LINPERHAP2_LOCUS29248 [Linum perenne]
MREKSRERGKRGKGVRGGCERDFGVESRSVDRSLRALEIRGRFVEISSSCRFADAGFRISVSYSGASHFIFLDELLLRWLGNVLQAAMEAGWKFGKGLVKRSGSRAIQVGTFSLKDVLFLRIMEICDLGKRFYVAIPSDPAAMGWSAWLKSIQSVLSGRQSSGGASYLRGCSYAAMVAKKLGAPSSSAMVAGESDYVREKVGKVNGITKILVDETGVNRRIESLKCWVVVSFSLGPKDFVAWEEFKVWMRRWWGVASNWTSKRLGDDSWLVECGSEVEVDRIIKDESWFFRGIRVHVQKWWPEAGRQFPASSQKMRWILVFGIPVHLRADSVFREIGERCGGFVECQETGFAAVRLKVKAGKSFPTSILLAARNEEYIIKLLAEPCSFPPMEVEVEAVEAPSAEQSSQRGEKMTGAAARVRGAKDKGVGPSNEFLLLDSEFGPSSCGLNRQTHQIDFEKDFTKVLLETQEFGSTGSCHRLGPLFGEELLGLMTSGLKESAGPDFSSMFGHGQGKLSARKESRHEPYICRTERVFGESSFLLVEEQSGQIAASTLFPAINDEEFIDPGAVEDLRRDDLEDKSDSPEASDEGSHMDFDSEDLNTVIDYEDMVERGRSLSTLFDLRIGFEGKSWAEDC